tara:strand:+ start:14 stop:442 length:429 start_codon:yes stop_codon:yes gene_type:complete
MIETRESVNTNVTPKTITTSMIDTDLKEGLNKRDMMEKYNIRKWEIDRIFKNPKLTGRRPSPKLSFTFVDDMPDADATTEEEFIDPNQVTIDQAIEETEEDSPTISQTAEDYGDADEDDEYISDETQDETVEDEDEFDSFEL